MIEVLLIFLAWSLIVIVPFGITKIRRRYRWDLRFMERVNLSFDQFFRFWQINPENWIVGDLFLDYRRVAKDDEGRIVTKYFSIILPRKDIPRYKKFVAKKREQEAIAKKNKVAADFIKLVQEDLNKFVEDNPAFKQKNNPMDAVRTKPLPRGFE